MSTIANKLTTIAENEKKIYDKGYSDCADVSITTEDVGTDFSGMFMMVTNPALMNAFNKLKGLKCTNAANMYDGVTDVIPPHMDMSECESVNCMFYCATLLEMPQYDLSKCKNLSFMYSNAYFPPDGAFGHIDAGSCEDFSGMFENASYLSAIESIDTHNGKNFHLMFASAGITSAPDLDISSVEMPHGLYEIFSFCGFLTRAKFTSSVAKTLYLDNYEFYYATKLKDFTLEGDITLDGGNVNFGDSPLSVDSAKNIISHLVDKNTDGKNQAFAYSIILSAETKQALDNNSAVIGNLNWRDYLDNIGWNVA